ncbi:FadR/GntR family transcriptional regulator [Rhizomonospora bruguierae]|uniref:FadR/GntR family transcriptional regulator n=1 Tax=Rhizomonospora bruguierae TaxID=1581705 RepID=UPI001BCA9C3A|nr:FCD domain-containing protein [Micromonospora sp. NBRC 107566]
MPLVSPARHPLVPQIIEQLRSQITNGEWPVGTRIPTEPQLVAALGVGRNTVREAVRALEHAGLLECRQGSGTYVIATDELAGAVARRLQGAEQAEAIEVRRAFEVEAARLAARRRTPDDLADLRRALGTREEGWRSGDAARFVEADARLHVAIVAAAHNGMLAALYASFGDALRASLAGQVGDALLPADYVDHTRLIEAIGAGDAARAAHEAGAFLETPGGELGCR